VLVTLFVAQFVPRFSAKASSFAVPLPAQYQRTRPGDLPIYTDLSGGQEPDQIQLFSSSNHRLIYIKFFEGYATELKFDVPTGSSGMLIADDVDNDNALDLIWLAENETAAFIWRGDGQGNFTFVEDASGYKQRLAQLSLSPFRQDVTAYPTVSNPGCITSNGDCVLTNGEFVPFVAFESLAKERARPVTGLNRSLAQLQNRPPPFIS
jgi:hypothetical protein